MTTGDEDPLQLPGDPMERARRIMRRAASATQEARTAEDVRGWTRLSLSSAVDLLQRSGLDERDLAPLYVLERALESLGLGYTHPVLKAAKRSGQPGKTWEGEGARAKAMAVHAVDLLKQNGRPLGDALAEVAALVGLPPGGLKSLRKQVHSNNGHSEVATYLRDLQLELDALPPNSRLAVVLRDLARYKPVVSASRKGSDNRIL